MSEKQVTDSESTENSNSDEDDEPIAPTNEPTDYEKQRQLRIAENKARMQVMGLRNIANSLMGSTQNKVRSRKVKSNLKKVVKEEDDDDYKPNDEDDDGNGNVSSFSDEDEEDRVIGKKSRGRFRKVKKSTSSKKKSMKQSMDISDIMDEDEALKQAIALSLKECAENSDLQHCGSNPVSYANVGGINSQDHGHFQEDNMRQKKRKSFSSRVQMTENDVVIHFCQFDETGKGSITLRDLQRMAAAHDFIWTDKELADMIHCFDSDRDGKLSLDDFQGIVRRCNMLQEPGNP